MKHVHSQNEMHNSNNEWQQTFRNTARDKSSGFFFFIIIFGHASSMPLLLAVSYNVLATSGWPVMKFTCDPLIFMALAG